MDNIINFPTKSVRDWLVIERAMKEALEKSAAPPTAQERIVQRMKAFYDLLDPDLNFSIPVQFPGTISNEETLAISTQVSERASSLISEKLQAFTNSLFIERLYREIDACKEARLL